MAAKSYFHLAANSTVSVSKNPCELVNVCINQLGTTSNTVTLYDNNKGDTSGSIIAVINTTSTVGVLNYNLQCLNGITAVQANGAAGDVTIVFG